MPDKQVVKKFKYFLLVVNLYPYSFWDYSNVKEHLMILSKRHIAGLDELNIEEKKEYAELICKFSKDFHIYTRTAKSNVKSIGHLHTHLIKTTGKLHKMLFYCEKPYTRITR